jgi:hypothetical protein
VTGPRFRPGQAVRVKALFPPGHCRTPFYTRGKRGRILDLVDVEPDPEERAYGRPGLPAVPVWRVVFDQHELWPDYGGPARDRVVVGIFEPWLEPLEDGA